MAHSGDTGDTLSPLDSAIQNILVALSSINTDANVPSTDGNSIKFLNTTGRSVIEFSVTLNGLEPEMDYCEAPSISIEYIPFDALVNIRQVNVVIENGWLTKYSEKIAIGVGVEDEVVYDYVHREGELPFDTMHQDDPSKAEDRFAFESRFYVSLLKGER